jgi:polyisoprenoid-binding protein YceI
MKYQIDNSHSQIAFSVRHMMIAKVRGKFQSFSGTIDLNEQNPEHTTVEVHIEAASIDTNDANRDKHLRSDDFFSADQYPHLIFKSTQVQLAGENRAHLHGNLTIREISKPVTLEVEYNGSAKSPWGTTSHGFTAHTVINRKDWDLTWNQALETGGVLVGDEITIDIELELVEQPVAEMEAAR